MPEQTNGTARQAPRPGNYRPVVDWSNNTPRRQQNASNNAHVGWIIGILVVALVLAIGYAASSNRKASDPVKSAPVVESKTATFDVPTPSTPPTGKSSGNKGKMNNNVNIEGNENNVHIGDKHYHDHYHSHTTVEKTTTVVVERPVTVVRERVVIVNTSNPPRRVDPCEDLRVQHETRVAVWKSAFSSK